MYRVRVVGHRIDARVEADDDNIITYADHILRHYIGRPCAELVEAALERQCTYEVCYDPDGQEMAHD